MADWATISALATAGGTLVLAIATFSAVRSSNRSARIAERAFQVGLRPLLVPSRLDDPTTKVLFAPVEWIPGEPRDPQGTPRWIRIEGGHGAIEHDEGVIYLVMGVRNVGSGIAVMRGWHIDRNESPLDSLPPLESFRRQQRDIYVPTGDPGFWQGALRDPNDVDYKHVASAVANREIVTIDILYGDHEGGQRTVSRFIIVGIGEAGWLCQVSRHWNIDRDDPR